MERNGLSKVGVLPNIFIFARSKPGSHEKSLMRYIGFVKFHFVGNALNKGRSFIWAA
jgi:hypothetical protein